MQTSKHPEIDAKQANCRYMRSQMDESTHQSARQSWGCSIYQLSVWSCLHVITQLHPQGSQPLPCTPHPLPHTLATEKQFEIQPPQRRCSSALNHSTTHLSTSHPQCTQPLAPLSLATEKKTGGDRNSSKSSCLKVNVRRTQTHIAH